MNKPTEAALNCAAALSVGKWLAADTSAALALVAEQIDRECDLPALIVVAMTAQGVVDAYERARPIHQPLRELQAAIRGLGGRVVPLTCSASGTCIACGSPDGVLRALPFNSFVCQRCFDGQARRAES